MCLFWQGTPGSMACPLLWGATPSCSSAWPPTPPNLPFWHYSKTLVRPHHLAFVLPAVPLSPRADIERLYGERKLLAERKPIPLSAAQCHQRAAAIQRAAATQRIRSFSTASVSSTGISEETAIDLDGPVFDRMFNPTGGLDNGAAGADTPTRMAKVTKHDLLNQYFRKDVVVWSNLDWFRCVYPARQCQTKRYIYICVRQDVRLPTYPVNHIHHRMCILNTYRCPPGALGTGPPPRARAPLAALPHVRARLVAPGTISEQVCRAPFCEELLLPTRGGSEGRHRRSV